MPEVVGDYPDGKTRVYQERRRCVSEVVDMQVGKTMFAEDPFKLLVERDTVVKNPFASVNT